MAMGKLLGQRQQLQSPDQMRLPTSWYNLAAEIRVLILRFLPGTGSGWAKYASVCSEWQYVLEEYKLPKVEAEAVVPPHLWRHGHSATAARPKGLAAHGTPRVYVQALQQETFHARVVRGRHDHRKEHREALQHLVRLVSCPKQPDAGIQYPFAQRWRVWHASIQELYDLGGFLCFLSILPSIQGFVLYLVPNSDLLYKNTSLLEYCLPKDLKRLTLFQDWNAKHITALRKGAHGPAGVLTVPDDRIAMALAKRSLSLENLAAASLAEASTFFRVCSPHWIWENLRYLALTSDKLAYHDSQDEETASKMGEMLESAGRVALRMLQLREMVLWNAQEGQAGAFIYQLKHGSSFVAWRGSWTYQIPAQVLSAWEEVSKTFTTYDLIAKPAELIENHVNSHAEWLALLQLPGPVVDPESLRQMRKEDALAR
ncbi:hypothetical protein C2857_006338 [Epichloe festucae Fl1]|uniref:DUF6546 domain-containing protein n=1 Tax=Epichloe festucae (strain Fl1) TaxID=877507 RepID=A0A7S9KLI5_EPIFF|nr:hypothetical protein C2857_006338 [Epichloe festucae Fl1]